MAEAESTAHNQIFHWSNPTVRDRIVAGWITTMSNQCSRCVFEFPDARGRTCVAFPSGIPAEIVDGRFDHTKAYVGDGGIRFVPRLDKRLPGDGQGTHHLDFGEWTPSKKRVVAVTVDELLAAVNGFLNSDVLLCPAADRDTDFIITIDEILVSVDDALNDCHFTANPSACHLPGTTQ
jgi:hypothetical protein